MGKSIYSAAQQHLIALLRDLRTEAGLKQSDLAAQLAKPQSFVSKYEAGERRLDIIELRAICEALGIGLVEFATRFEEAFTNDESA